MKKAMDETTFPREKRMLDRPVLVVIMAALGIAIGIFFIVSQSDTGFIWLGAVACFAGVFLIAYVIASRIYKRKEAARHKQKEEICGGDSAVLRYADFAVKSRILLEAKAEGYTICYRRVKSTNELVINGRVYDEKKGFFEFEHKLMAVVGGHTIEAGYDGDEHSYITFDGNLIEYKRRLI